jgi:hypothetical protein
MNGSRRAGRTLRPALVVLVGVLLAGEGALLAAEVWGKPLKGLSAVPVREVVTHPEHFVGRDIRVAGPNSGEEGKPALKDGDALLPIVSDGSFELPAKLAGTRLAAEGRVKKDGSSVVFAATGLEVRR